MKALELTEPKLWRAVSIPEPSVPGPDEVLVKIQRVGICGTDISGYLGKMPFFSYPRIPGHELGVEVLQAGERVSHVRPGDRCAVEPYINCQTCYSCTRGHTNCCERHLTLGVMCDGGLAERMILPGRKVHPAPALTTDQCALVETLAIGCHAVNRSRSQANETVLIVGAGPIGLSALEFARLSGARVLMADISPQRLAFVQEQMQHADVVQFGDPDANLAAISRLTDGRMADVVIDATGNSHSMQQSLALASFVGRIVYVGITADEIKFFQAPHFHRRELSILASRNAVASDFTRIIQLISEGTIDTRPWITHRVAFDDVPTVFADLIQPAAGMVKGVVTVAD